MENTNRNVKSAGAIIKELFFCGIIILVLLEMDRCLENLYPYLWYDTGIRIVDLWIAFEMRTHAILAWLIPAGFIVWMIIGFVKKQKRDLGLLIPIIICYLVIFVLSYVADGNVSRWSNTAQYPVVMLLFLTMQCSTECGVKRLSRIGADVYIFLLAVNLIFIVFPKLYFTGWSPENFIGQYNLTGFPMATGMVYALLDNRVNGNKIRLWIYAVLFFVNLYLIWCATNLIMGFVFLLYLVFPFVKKAVEKWNLWVFVGFSLVMFAALMWFLVPVMSLKPMAWFATTVLKQDVTLSQRQMMWEEVMKMVYEKPIFGHGLGNSPAMWQDPRWTSEYVMHAHNCWLQTLYEGGIVYLVAILGFFAVAARRLRNSANRKLVGITIISIFAVLIMQEANIEAWFVWFPVFQIIQLGVLFSAQI